MGRPGACTRAVRYRAYREEEGHGTTAPVNARTVHPENITTVNAVWNTDQGISWFFSFTVDGKIV